MKIDRRYFIKKVSYAGLSIPVVYASYLPKALELIGLADPIEGKSAEMRVLNSRPVNAETPAHLLNDSLTPNELFFVRNNGIPPSNIKLEEWTLEIGGESVKNTKTYILSELKSKFKNYKYNITLECGGNGRSEFNPPAKGNQWSTGAVGCAEWTGVRLKDVLADAGVKDDAVYIAYHGKDTHLSGDKDKEPISRGVPIEKAKEEECLIAWAMNGEDLPLMNGYPLRLVIGGVPASCSGKWLSKIDIRNKVHDGPKMGGQSYRVPCKTVAPGAKVADEDMCIIERMPVKSIISYPKTGAIVNLGETMTLKGHAWTAAQKITAVHYSIDFGKRWQTCSISASTNKYAWQDFTASVQFPKEGYYEVWAKATDADGDTQPIILPGWNPKGYLNNACHRIAVRVDA